MPPRDDMPNLVRIVEGRRGKVKMAVELIIRLDYGLVVPWCTRSRTDGSPSPDPTPSSSTRR